MQDDRGTPTAGTERGDLHHVARALVRARPVVVIATVVALVVGVVIIVQVVRGARGTACDRASFRVGLRGPGSAPPPPIGGGSLSSRIHRAFHGTSPAVFCDDFPDPFVLRVGRLYYAYSTTSHGDHVPVLTTGSIFGGGGRHEALPHMPAWTDGRNAWAPAVLQRGRTFVMYYAPGMPDGRHCLSIAVATNPAGPFVDGSRAPFVCTPASAIDPSPFVAPNGQPYLVWKGASAIEVAPLRGDGLGLAGPAISLVTASQPWEHGIVEGPSMIAASGVVYLFYSGGQWDSANYAIGYAVCATPLGPCTKAPTNPWLASNPTAQGPGGQEFFTDPSGRLWMVFHAWVDGKVGYPTGARNLFVVHVTFVNGTPQAA